MPPWVDCGIFSRVFTDQWNSAWLTGSSTSAARAQWCSVWCRWSHHSKPEVYYRGAPKGIQPRQATKDGSWQDVLPDAGYPHTYMTQLAKPPEWLKKINGAEWFVWLAKLLNSTALCGRNESVVGRHQRAQPGHSGGGRWQEGPQAAGPNLKWVVCHHPPPPPPQPWLYFLLPAVWRPESYLEFLFSGKWWIRLGVWSLLRKSAFSYFSKSLFLNFLVTQTNLSNN